MHLVDFALKVTVWDEGIKKIQNHQARIILIKSEIREKYPALSG